MRAVCIILWCAAVVGIRIKVPEGLTDHSLSSLSLIKIVVLRDEHGTLWEYLAIFLLGMSRK